ncbi:hypothetical protein V502_03115 [Pseudogymnoascus sp. VKM F-4520 (FW-2644)]|nr:hypothetical protein V502_03115 [Pseudogymnoascus sp. VKM F-4520 (FW-2644)]
MTSTPPTSVSNHDNAASTPSPTATKLLTLKTPFVQRPDCASIWDLTSVPLRVSGVSTSVTILVSDAADERFASCQPSGWDSIVPASCFSFSPAVCPSGWTYYAMASTVSVADNGRDESTFSTAYCCASGHSLGTGLSDFPIATMTPPCYRRVDAGEVSIMGTLSHGAGSTRLFTEGIQAHQAWHISWGASDTSTLTPSLPELTSKKLIPTWVPGETIEKGMYDRDHGDDEAVPGLNKLSRDLAIALPLIFVTLSKKCSVADSQAKQVDINHNSHPFYNYTSGRWLYNEHLRLAERQLHFNINALCQVVAKSVQQSSDNITLFTKIAEGGSYRVFEASFRDGSRAIARLPYPCTIPRGYGVASEVATMEFLRSRGVPIPRVFCWDSSASNEVGSEYIVMEYVPWRDLSETWQTMTFKERMAIVEKIVHVERILFGVQFPASGSLYFKDFLGADETSVDIPDGAGVTSRAKFCVGPSSEYLWWSQTDIRLPLIMSLSTIELLTAIGERETKWLQKFGEKRYPREPLYREFYDHQLVDPQVQIKHLADYLKVAPHLVPDGEELNAPTIRHPDLSPSNIFISETGKITGIIDWQHTSVLPSFLQAKIPKHFQNYGDDDSENFRRPKLAEGVDSISESDREVEMELYRRRQVHYFYLGYTSNRNKPHFDAMGKYNLVLRNQLYETAARPWEGDNTSLQAQLIRTLEHWPEIRVAGEAPPVQYSEAELQECLERDAKQRDADEQMHQVREAIGVDVEGWVPNNEFESAKARAGVMKSEMAQAAESEEERREFEELWPFQDHEETD